MAYFKREISSRIENLVKTFPCLVVTGARQVGKTTLLEHLFPKFNKVSLDLPSRAEQAEKEPALFLEQNPEPLLIDEIQYAPALFRYLKIRIDTDRTRMGRYVLTGSQKFSLMKEVSDSLAGRTAVVNLENLSLSELTLGQGPQWVDLMVRGMYPELWRQPELKTAEFYSSYVSTYLERDVRQILNVHSLRDFERFLRSCAARSGQLLNLSDLARDVGIKSQTARDWLSVLEASNQISLLEPYFENVGKRIIKSPKLFLNDPGMLCFLIGLEGGSFASSPLVGAVWETFVFAEFRKYILRESTPHTLWYYRDSQGTEVDFLLVGSGKIRPVEVKWTENVDERWLKILEEVSKTLSKSKTQTVGEATLLCRTSVPLHRNGVRITSPDEYFRFVLPINKD